MFGTTAVVYDLIARDNASRVLRKVERSAGGVESGFSRMGRVVKVAGAALAGTAAVVGAASIKMSVEFQSSMAKIQTMAGGSAKDVRDLSKAVLDLGNYAEQSPNELANSLYHLKSVGMDNVAAMKALKQSSDLAAVGGNSLEETTNALAGAWRSGIKGAGNFKSTVATLNAVVGAGNMKMEDLTSAMSTGLLPSAKSFGVSLKEVGAALALMTDEGIPAQQASTRLRMSLSLLAAPSGAAEKVLAGIGLSGHKLGETLRKPNGLIDTIQLLKDHLAGMNNYYPDPQKAAAFVAKWKDTVTPLLKLDPSKTTAAQEQLINQYGQALENHSVLVKGTLDAAEQAAVLSKAFGGGRSSSAILTLINNLDVLKQKQDQINKSMGRFGQSVAAQRKTAEAQFKLLESGLEVLAIKLGNVLLPPVVDFVRFLNARVVPAVSALGGWLGRVVPVAKIKADFHKAASYAADFFDGLSGHAHQTRTVKAGPLFPGGPHRLVQQILPASSARKLGATIHAAIASALSTGNWGKLGGIIGKGLGDAIGHLGNFANTLVKSFAGIDWVTIGTSVGKTAIPFAIGFINSLLDPLFSGSFWSKHWSDVLFAIASFIPVGKVAGIFGKVFEHIPVLRMFSPLLKGMDTAASKLWRAVVRLVKFIGKGFLDGFRTVFPEVGKVFEDYLVLLPTRLGVMALDLLQKGRDLLEKLGSGILSALNAPGKALGRAFGLMLKAVRDFFTNPFRNMLAIIAGLFMTFVGNILNGAAKAFGWIPGLGPKLKSASANFDQFKNSVNRSLAGIHNHIVLDFTAHYSNSAKRAMQQQGLTGTGYVPAGNLTAGKPIHHRYGGPVRAGQAYVVNEQGQEMFIPDRNGTVVPHGQSGRGKTVNIYIDKMMPANYSEFTAEIDKRDRTRSLGVLAS